MNPACRIWSIALACCFAFVLIASAFNPEAGAFLFIAFFIVAITSLASLLGFYMLFETLRLITAERRKLLAAVFIGVPSIVLFNAWILICLFDGRLRFDLSEGLKELFLLAGIPLVGSIVGMLASYKHIKSFFTPVKSQELFPQP